MITRLTHTTIYVTDQDESKAFYTEKLGFTVAEDMTMGDFRWLAVSPPQQPDLFFVLFKVAASDAMDETTANQLREILSKGAMGTGVLATDDCRATYEELRARGVEFISPPQDQFYGVEALFRDNSGNFFSLTQRKGA